jgi:hypothetical protein
LEAKGHGSLVFAANIRISLLIIQCLAWAALATLPPEFLSQGLGWQALSPESAISQVVWMPIALYCQLKILATRGLPVKLAPATALPSVIGVEFLLALRFCKVLLLWLLPALAAFSLLGLETFNAKIIVMALAVAGSVPAVLWFLRRLCATAVVLWQGLSAGAAIDESARLAQGKLKSVIVPLLLWNALALLVEFLGLASDALNAVVLPLSLLITTFALGGAYRKLTL